MPAPPEKMLWGSDGELLADSATQWDDIVGVAPPSPEMLAVVLPDDYSGHLLPIAERGHNATSHPAPQASSLGEGPALEPGCLGGFPVTLLNTHALGFLHL